MGRLFVLSLEGKIYSCKHCRTHLALSEDIVSKVVLINQRLNLFCSSFCDSLLKFELGIDDLCLVLVF